MFYKSYLNPAVLGNNYFFTIYTEYNHYPADIKLCNKLAQIKSYLFLLIFLFLFNSTNYSQWVRQTNGLQSSPSFGEAIDACNNNTALIGFNNILYLTYDAGDSWQNILFSSPDANITDLTILDKLHFWLSTDAGKILATTNGGTDWTLQFYDTTITEFINYIKMFDLNNGIAMGDSKNTSSQAGPAVFLRTTNGGSNWNSVNDSAFRGYSGDMWRRLDFPDINHGYFFESGIIPQKLFKTTDGCKTWTATNYSNAGADLIKFYNTDIGLVVNISNDGLKWYVNRTVDGSNSWETFPMNTKGWPNDIEFLPGNPAKVWYVDLESLYYSQDTGRTWVEQKIFNGALSGRDLVFTDSTHGWLICDSGKVFHTSNNGGNITDIRKTENNIPSNYSLAQNYPNPFNPSTVINWQLPKGSFVTLKVYDILGNEVAILVNEFQNAGGHEIVFTTQQTRNKQLTSGIYFYRIQAGEFSETRKLVLLK
jgi:photosystem II stability/assembly factor-like uncharacterized protein